MNTASLAVPTHATRARAAYGIYLRETRAALLRAWRTPAFAVPTLILPWAFYALFAIVLAPPGSGTAGYALATYGIFAALGPCLSGFGIGVAADRDLGILRLKQVSPLPPAAFLIARLGASLVFTAVVLVGLYALAAWGAGVELPRRAWLALAGVHLSAVAPFCLLGLCIGLRAPGSAAVALSNVLFLALSVLGGLWIPLFLFPAWMQRLAVALPTSHLAALALAAAGRGDDGHALGHAAFVAAFALGCAVLARRFWSRGAR